MFRVAQPGIQVGGYLKRFDQLGVDLGLPFVRQAISEVASLVQPTPLDQGLGAEHLPHRRRERLDVIDDRDKPPQESHRICRSGQHRTDSATGLFTT